MADPTTATAINTARHPLSNGVPPDWASGWGEDDDGVFVEFTIENVVTALRWCRPGRFLMGPPKDEPGRWSGEGSPVEITFREGFWMMETPVTQALYEAVTGENPSRFKSPERPVEQVSWRDAMAFIAAANERLPGLLLDLPSEAMWEYACRAGTIGATYAGPMEILGEHNAPILDEIAWYGGNSGVEFDLENGADSSKWSEKQYPHTHAGTRLVKQKEPNPWGVQDMLGNVWEWCSDEWRGDHEGADPAGLPRTSSQQEGGSTNSEGGDDSERGRVVRGGAWSSVACYCRAACRRWDTPENRYDYLGFRCSAGQVVSPASGRRRGESAYRHR